MSLKSIFAVDLPTVHFLQIFFERFPVAHVSDLRADSQHLTRRATRAEVTEWGIPSYGLPTSRGTTWGITRESMMMLSAARRAPDMLRSLTPGNSYVTGGHSQMSKVKFCQHFWIVFLGCDVNSVCVKVKAVNTEKYRLIGQHNSLKRYIHLSESVALFTNFAISDHLWSAEYLIHYKNTARNRSMAPKQCTYDIKNKMVNAVGNQ